MNNSFRGTFSDYIEEYLNYNLNSFVGSGLNRESLISIQRMIYDKLNEIFLKCNFSLEEKTVQFISDQYFKNINFNSNIMTPIEIENNINKISNSDLDMIMKLFHDTDFASEIENEISRRAR
jgi:hypothetical protein